MVTTFPRNFNVARVKNENDFSQGVWRLRGCDRAVLLASAGQCDTDAIRLSHAATSQHEPLSSEGRSPTSLLPQFGDCLEILTLKVRCFALARLRVTKKRRDRLTALACSNAGRGILKRAKLECRRHA